MIFLGDQPTMLLLLEIGRKVIFWLVWVVRMVEISYACLVWRNSCSLVHAGVFPGNKPPLTLTYLFFSTYPRMHWIIRDSQNWVTAEILIHYISVASLSVYSSQCEYQSWNYRQQYKWSVVFKSSCSLIERSDISISPLI